MRYFERCSSEQSKTIAWTSKVSHRRRQECRIPRSQFSPILKGHPVLVWDDSNREPYRRLSVEDDKITADQGQKMATRATEEIHTIAKKTVCRRWQHTSRTRPENGRQSYWRVHIIAKKTICRRWQHNSRTRQGKGQSYSSIIQCSQWLVNPLGKKVARRW